MKVLFLTTRSGGPHTLSKQLYKHLLSNKKEIIVDLKYNYLSYLKAIFSNNYDIIHTCLPLPFNVFRTPIILNIHGNFKKEYSKFNLIYYLYKISIFFAKQIIVPSKYLSSKLSLDKDVLVIPNFVSSIHEMNNKKLNSLILKCIFVTNFNYLDKCSGLLDLGRIIKKLPSNYSFKLDIYGGGIYFNLIRSKFLDLNLSNNIEISWIGFSNNFPEIYENYDLCLNYSNLDTFSMTLVDSMSYGLPVLTNEFGAAKEIITSGLDGFISVSKKDYLISLKKLLSDSDLRNSISDNAKKKIKSNFLISDVCEKFYSVYEKILKN